VGDGGVLLLEDDFGIERTEFFSPRNILDCGALRFSLVCKHKNTNKV
jgi:hypothetical protein